MLDIEKNQNRTTHLYMEVYEYYRKLILDGKMTPGSKMPSLRKCSQELKLSRTTIETAYLQLAADGYIMAKAQSGYYVTEIASHQHKNNQPGTHKETYYRYDLASSGVDKESFRFDLWSRYMKSALRQNERMLTYGEPQGEADFRETLSDYIRERRNILCSPDDIVVGASFQSLLQILCPLIHEVYPEFHRVSFPTPSFVHGSTVFGDYGYEICYRNKDCDVVYVSPAHMTKWGEIMPVKRRLELLKYANERHHLVIEDDFENEFVYFQKPTPSLFGLSGGQGVVYIGSFSRLLLPSIRISFMILPPELLNAYKKKAGFYNQTASISSSFIPGNIRIKRFLRIYRDSSSPLISARIMSNYPPMLVTKVWTASGIPPTTVYWSTTVTTIWQMPRHCWNPLPAASVTSTDVNTMYVSTPFPSLPR